MMKALHSVEMLGITSLNNTVSHPRRPVRTGVHNDLVSYTNFSHAVWCALSTVGIVRPVLLQRNVNSEHHGAILEDNPIPIF